MNEFKPCWCSANLFAEMVRFLLSDVCNYVMHFPLSLQIWNCNFLSTPQYRIKAARQTKFLLNVAFVSYCFSSDSSSVRFVIKRWQCCYKKMASVDSSSLCKCSKEKQETAFQALFSMPRSAWRCIGAFFAGIYVNNKIYRTFMMRNQ